MLKTFNHNLQRAGRKRRAHFLKLYLAGAKIKDLARDEKVTYERMRGMIRKAEGERGK